LKGGHYGKSDYIFVGGSCWFFGSNFNVIFILGTYFGCVVTLIFIVSKIDGFKNAVCDGNPKERVRRFGQIK